MNGHGIGYIRTLDLKRCLRAGKFENFNFVCRRDEDVKIGLYHEHIYVCIMGENSGIVSQRHGRKKTT